MRTILAWLLLAGASIAQITVPPSTEPYKIVEATVTSNMPQGADMKGGWKIPEGLDHRKVNATMIYLTGKPGDYLLLFSGYWIHLGPEITVKDINGVEQTFRPYLGSDAVDERAPFSIVGGVDPDPDPDPPNPPEPDPPGPGGKYQLMFFLEANELDSLPKEQAEIVTSLVHRVDLRDKGHRFLMVVDDGQIKAGVPVQYKPWIDAVIGKPLPRIAIAPIDGGPISDYPMPSSYDDLLKLLEDPLKWVANRLVREVNR